MYRYLTAGAVIGCTVLLSGSFFLGSRIASAARSGANGPANLAVAVAAPNTAQQRSLNEPGARRGRNLEAAAVWRWRDSDGRLHLLDAAPSHSKLSEHSLSRRGRSADSRSRIFDPPDQRIAPWTRAEPGRAWSRGYDGGSQTRRDRSSVGQPSMERERMWGWNGARRRLAPDRYSDEFHSWNPQPRRLQPRVGRSGAGRWVWADEGLSIYR